MKRLVSVIIAILVLSTSAFAQRVDTNVLELENNSQVVNVKKVVNNEQYAEIGYLENGKTVWSATTNAYPMAMIDSISDCYVNGDVLYYVEGRTLKAVELKSGQLIWASDVECGTSGIIFDKYGNIYNHGFFGPDLVVLNKDGALLYEDRSEAYGRTHNYRIEGDTLFFDCEYDSVYGDESTRSLNISQFKPVSVLLNGNTINFDRQPFIQNGRTLVPVRAIFEALGATVGWDPETEVVSATNGEISVTMAIGSNRMYVNGAEKVIDVPAQLVGDRTFVPARAISEAFGCDVNWDESTYTVLITD